jgi:type IV pilus assembly protein PilA
MRRLVVCLAVAMLWAGSSSAQGAASAQQTAAAAVSPTLPQTARQALLEMFFSKTPGTLAKHLPAATRAALDKSGALKSLDQYSMLMSQFQTQGQTIQTYETGSVLLSGEDAKKDQRIEITVENDALRGEQDDIEVSFQVYKNGAAQKGPFLPHMIFSMKQEDQVWTLNEISVTIHLPLADPDFLKAITEKMTPQVGATGVTGTFAPRPGVSAQAGGNDAMVVAAMRTILTAELTYASSYPNVGFSCTLSNLDGFGGGDPNEHQAMLINSGLASGKRYGFVFSLSGCGGTPATSFHLTAAPNGNSYGRKAYCADQSGVIRSSSDGNPATCMASGIPLQ